MKIKIHNFAFAFVGLLVGPPFSNKNNNAMIMVAGQVLDTCTEFHDEWSSCAQQEGCAFCVALEPADCNAYSTNVCGLKTCCPACDSIVIDKYQPCAEAQQCITPDCNIMTSGPGASSGPGAGSSGPAGGSGEMIVGGVDPNAELSVNACASAHSDWEACVESNGCNFCPTTMPGQCSDYSGSICGKKNCCEPCKSILLDSFVMCAEGEGCTTPGCEIADVVDGNPTPLLVECSDYHGTWSSCVADEGCMFCDTTFMDSCVDYSSHVCGWKNCCPACEALITEEYESCAESAGCTTPGCEIVETGNNEPLVETISDCSSFHDMWVACVENQSNCEFCSKDMPSDCNSYSVNVCGWKTCCPPCEAMITGDYMTCADQVQCVTPDCNIVESDESPTASPVNDENNNNMNDMDDRSSAPSYSSRGNDGRLYMVLLVSFAIMVAISAMTL